jgi:hypothetical protein
LPVGKSASSLVEPDIRPRRGRRVGRSASGARLMILPRKLCFSRRRALGARADRAQPPAWPVHAPRRHRAADRSARADRRYAEVRSTSRVSCELHDAVARRPLAQDTVMSVPFQHGCRHRRARVPDPPASPGSRDPPGGAQTVLRLHRRSTGGRGWASCSPAASRERRVVPLGTALRRSDLTAPRCCPVRHRVDRAAGSGLATSNQRRSRDVMTW